MEPIVVTWAWQMPFLRRQFREIATVIAAIESHNNLSCPQPGRVSSRIE